MARTPTIQVPMPKHLIDEFRALCEYNGQTMAARTRSLMIEDMKKAREMSRYRKIKPPHY